MHIRDLNEKRVCILGFGREGKAMFHAIEQHAPYARITVADKNADAFAELANPNRVTSLKSGYTLQSGSRWLHHITSFDVVIKSPGIPPSVLPVIHDSPLTTSTQIFLDSIAGTGATVIGVTGSKGKSTTSSLIHTILRAAGKDAHLVGNIGTPSIAYIDRARNGTIFVLEMSSYQLMDLTCSPQIAVVTSFFPEHLDYHGSFDAYREAKTNIARFQGSGDVVFYAADSPGAFSIARATQGRCIPFSADDAPVRIEETQLLGRHNLSNIAGAYAIACQLGVPPTTAITAIANFQSLPHRLQSLGVHGGVAWVDDAISTTPQSAIAALDALGDRVRTILLGGQNRGYDFAPLAERLHASAVTTVIFFPGSGPCIREAMREYGAWKEGSRTTTRDIAMFDVTSMEDAVVIAARATRNREPETSQSPIVLLSPASPSYGMFASFEEKGKAFARCIRALRDH